MKRISALAFILISGVMASPNSLDVIFLSPQSAHTFNPRLSPFPPLFQTHTAIATNKGCQKMGEYCFDPQIGLYRPDINEKNFSEVDVLEESRYPFIDPFAGIQRDMIECDGAQIFDIFCGKAKKAEMVRQQVEASLEIWIDISSTFRQVDPPRDEGQEQCFRRDFVSQLQQICPHVIIKTFTNKLKNTMMGGDLCQHDGLNDMKSLMHVLNETSSKHLLIVTDIFEAEEEFINTVEKYKSHHLKGLDTPFYASQLLSQIELLKSFCKDY